MGIMDSEIQRGEQADKPAQWPEELLAVFERSVTCMYASLTSKGQPITYPVNPYISEDRLALEITTGLTYPAKANRARRNPKVSLLFDDPVGSKLENPPVVLVLGQASVRTADLQANTDRYVRASIAKLPEASEGSSPRLVESLGWYFARIWIQVTPLEIYWWQRDHPETPHHWIAPEGTIAPPSDPAPKGRAPRAWARKPKGWHRSAHHAVQNLGLPTLTVVNDAGYPFSLPAFAVALSREGFRLTLPANLPISAQGKACLTFHTHPERFTSQQNHVFIGEVNGEGEQAHFRVERQLADWSLNGSRLHAAWGLLSKVFVLSPRLKREAARYGQPVPKVHLPEGFSRRRRT
jgi:hypothetical protein